MLKKYTKKESGYTIIETMIAVSLFLIVVTTGIGALLNANLLHQKSASMRSIMDNLSFAMEDMNRIQLSLYKRR
jgi:Tfp pilus assembly protein PilV